jgi:hypothetical protein
MKNFEKPMLQIVSINKSDIITTSDPALSGTFNGETILAPRRRDIWTNAGH